MKNWSNKIINSILFVCSGNTCRSIIAEGICKKILKEKGFNKVKINSAGVYALKGVSPLPVVIEILKKYGITKTFKSKNLKLDYLKHADLVLTMTNVQKEEIIKNFPFIQDKVFVFKNYIGTQGDIEDPIGKNEEIYKHLAEELVKGINLLIEKLTINIIIGSDHGGYELKHYLLDKFKGTFVKLYDFNNTSKDIPIDYPDIGFKIGEIISSGRFKRGILICTTGVGMSIVANKILGIRAALCHNIFTARLSSAHNKANILVLGEKVVKKAMATKIIKIWLETPFEEGRHLRRINKILIKEKEKNNNKC